MQLRLQQGFQRVFDAEICWSLRGILQIHHGAKSENGAKMYFMVRKCETRRRRCINSHKKREYVSIHTPFLLALAFALGDMPYIQ